MGNLFHNVLGNYSAGNLDNTGPFSNVQLNKYWSDTEDTLNLGMYFTWFDGLLRNDFKTNSNYIWAVHSGDVSAVSVPVAAWLFGSGLIGLAGLTRHKKS